MKRRRNGTQVSQRSRTPAKQRSRSGRPWLVKFYRLAILAALVWMLRTHHDWIKHHEEDPVRVDELREFFAQAERLVADRGPRRGGHILDGDGRRLGYVVRTSPRADSIIGYCGPTDTMMVFAPDERLLAIRIRRSWDTIMHAEDVATDKYFMNFFNGMAWDEIAELDIQGAGIEGVSGATMTSMCVVESMKYRVGEAVQQNIPPPRDLRIRLSDVGIVIVLAVAIAFSFTRVARRRRLRRTFQVAVIAYLGFYLGEMIALPLLVGWAQSGVPWHAVPGMTLLVAAAFLIPFVTRRPTYCAQICPHGAAQEILGRVTRRKLRVPPGLRDGLRWLPWLLLAFAVVVVMLLLPIDLASIEPFDAYVFRSAGWATISIAVAGLIASLFTAQAYCKYGCPTGALLEAVRSHGRADRFNRRDAALGLLLILAAIIHWQYPLIYRWIVGF